MRPVTPCYIKFGNCWVKPCYDVIEFWQLMVLLCANLSVYRTRLFIMPRFEPNDYMIKHFAHKVATGDKPVEDWEVYAWCVRDAMAKQSGMAVSDMPMAKKLEFEKFMNFQTGHVEINDMRYTIR